jgi:hypothetical protein
LSKLPVTKTKRPTKADIAGKLLFSIQTQTIPVSRP